jgi:hypothetical protein
MPEFLKQSTAATVNIGPFLDSTDGVTAETGLSITQADVRLSKNGADFAQMSAAVTATHDENGYYKLLLSTTDTGTLGRLDLAVAESGALPVWHYYGVMPANVYDSFFSTDYLKVDVVESTLTWTGGAGSTAQTIRITDSDDVAIPDAEVWLTSDIAGTNVVAGTLTTNDDGDVTFYVDLGSTYYVWFDKAGDYGYTNPVNTWTPT